MSKPYVNQNSNDRPFGYAMLSPCSGLYKRFTDHITFTFSLDFNNKALDFKHGVVLPGDSRPTQHGGPCNKNPSGGGLKTGRSDRSRRSDTRSCLYCKRKNPLVNQCRTLVRDLRSGRAKPWTSLRTIGQPLVSNVIPAAYAMIFDFPQSYLKLHSLSRRIKQFIIEFYRKFAAMALHAE